jgi:hypothetical protein
MPASLEHKQRVLKHLEGIAGIVADDFERAVSSQNFGAASAVKRGRRPEWPYVPIIDHGTHTEQLRGLAYETRAQAIDVAQRAIDARRASFRQKLYDPRYRALREQHALPREISKFSASRPAAHAD